MLVQVSHCPEATQTASEGTPLVGGAVVAAVVGVVVGGAVVPVALPVHATPLRLNAVGAGLVPVHEALKPNDVVPLVATEPL